MEKSLFLFVIAAGLLLLGARCDGAGVAKCMIPECYRAINCVEECGGPVIQSSCCACPPGTFDDIDCDAGGADSP